MAAHNGACDEVCECCTSKGRIQGVILAIVIILLLALGFDYISQKLSDQNKDRLTVVLIALWAGLIVMSKIDGK